MKLRTHLVIPDTQLKEGVPMEHMEWIGKYIVDKEPDTIIHLGDFADMPSLSSYDKGKKDFEGRRYWKDVQAANEGMDILMQPIKDHNVTLKRNKKKLYKPRKVLLLGNHENRINRAIDCDSILEGTISTDDFNFKKHGWEVHEFLEPVVIDGVKYAHFFPRNPNGRVMQNTRGAPSAAAQVRREMMSCTSGHLQGLDWSVYQTGERRVYGMIAGSCYQHEEKYLTPQGTQYWRGIIMKHEVHDGNYDPMFVSLDYLRRRYG